MNYLAILACGVASMIIGFVWYGPLFGRAQRESMGEATMTQEQKDKMKKAMGGMFLLQFILSLITASILSFFIMHSEYVSAMTVAIAAWFGFIMPTIGGAALWSGKPSKTNWRMFFISAASHLVTFVVYALILGAWK